VRTEDKKRAYFFGWRTNLCLGSSEKVKLERLATRGAWRRVARAGPAGDREGARLAARLGPLQRGQPGRVRAVKDVGLGPDHESILRHARIRKWGGRYVPGRSSSFVELR